MANLYEKAAYPNPGFLPARVRHVGSQPDTYPDLVHQRPLLDGS